MIRLAEKAKADLRKIRTRLKPRAGIIITDRVTETILTAIARLEPGPRRGRPGRVPGTRELLITRYPYIVIYEVDGDDVTVARILHQRMLWPRPEGDDG